MTSSTQLDPAFLDDDGGTYWDHARREYLAGVKATTICQKYGMSLSSFRMHARAGGWRRVDQPVCEVPPEFGEYHPDDPVSFAELADPGDIQGLAAVVALHQADRLGHPGAGVQQTAQGSQKPSI